LKDIERSVGGIMRDETAPVSAERPGEMMKGVSPALARHRGIVAKADCMIHVMWQTHRSRPLEGIDGRSTTAVAQENTLRGRSSPWQL
jgi:hypothetical protein